MMRTMSPRPSMRASAARTVPRDTLKRSANERSVGKRVPGPYSDEEIKDIKAPSSASAAAARGLTLLVASKATDGSIICTLRYYCFDPGNRAGQQKGPGKLVNHYYVTISIVGATRPAA